MTRPSQHYDTVEWEDYSSCLEEMTVKLKAKILEMAEGEEAEYSNGAVDREKNWLAKVEKDYAVIE